MKFGLEHFVQMVQREAVTKADQRGTKEQNGDGKFDHFLYFILSYYRLMLYCLISSDTLISSECDSEEEKDSLLME